MYPPPRETASRNSCQRLAAAQSVPTGAILLATALLSPSVEAASNYHNQLAHPQNTASYQSEATMLAWGSTNVIVAYQDLDQTGTVRNIGAGRSRSSGYVWSTDTTLAGPAGDPVLARNSINGYLYFTYITPDNPVSWSNPFRLQVRRSTDDGQTWGNQWDMTSISLFANVSQQSWDKPHLAVDNTPGSGQGTIYLAALREVLIPGSGQISGLFVVKSTDHGNTWTTLNNNTALALMEKNAQQFKTRIPSGVSLAVGADANHSLYVFWGEGTRTGTADTDPWAYAIKMRKSSNSGSSFTTEATVKTLAGGTTYSDGHGNLGLGSPYFRSDCYPRAVAHPTDGNQVFVVYPEKGTNSDMANLRFSRTLNGGTSWTDELISDANTTDAQYQPVVALQPAGKRLFVGFASINAAGTSIGIRGRIAKLSGTTVTWQTQFDVSDVNFAPHVQSASYMGDYDAAAADDLAFYYAWGDNRDAAANQHSNVRFARIPIVPDSYQLTELSTYGSGSGGYAAGEAMNNNGEIAGYWALPWFTPTFRYRYGAEKSSLAGYTSLSTSTANDPLHVNNNTFAYCITDGGNSLIGAYTPDPFDNWGATWKWAFRKRYGYPIAEQLTLNLSDPANVVPIWINQNEYAVGYGKPLGVTRGAYWPPSNPVATDLETLWPGNTSATSIATGINKAGRIVGQADASAGVYRAFRTIWSAAGTEGYPIIQPFSYGLHQSDDLGTLGGSSSFGQAIAESGAVVGGAQIANGSWHAFLCGPDPNDISNARKIILADDLGTLGGNSSQALAIDANGNFVVGNADTAAGSGMFIHYCGEKTMRALAPMTYPMVGWSGTSPIGVIKDGRIGGNGANPSGVYRNFLLTPVVN